ncbi:MAG TPA: hypothetical protein ENJ28_00495 [Gammaproteobacteria bacterium]|nr:hypothetical protein [Gammaproteobacteria bacterium]
MKCSNGFGLGLLTAGLLLANMVQASEWADRTTISGFSSAVFQVSNDTISYNGIHDKGISHNGSFAGTRFGININSQVNDKISLASQLISSQDNDTYNTKIDWAFVSYQLSENMSLRTGKVKYPVGIANEYVSVGYAYPWITPPQVFYTLSSQGPQVTREAYTGASFLWQKSVGDISYSVDLFGGEVALENMMIHAMKGLTVSADWNDEVMLQVSSYAGKMENDNMALMDGEVHSSNVLGIKIDMSDIVAYAEYAKVDMGAFEAGNSTAWYGSLGYRLDNLLPYVNFGMYEKGKGAMMMENMVMVSAHNKQYVATAGIKYDILPQTDVKFEVSRVHTSVGKGLFKDTGFEADVNIYSVAIDVVF